MGVETAVIVMAAVSTASTIGKMGFDIAAEGQKEKQIDLLAKQSMLQYQQKNLANLDVMQKILDAQAVQLSTRGVSFSSPSFNAIQRATLNIGAKERRNLLTQESFMDENAQIEKENSRRSLYASLFGDTAKLASNMLTVAGKLPQME